MPGKEEAPFKIGDIVYVKSGGPAMTVDGYGAFKTISCVWFDGTKHLAGRFEPEALTNQNPNK